MVDEMTKKMSKNKEKMALLCQILESEKREVQVSQISTRFFIFFNNCELMNK